MRRLYITIKSVWLEPGTQAQTYIDEIELKTTLPLNIFWLSKDIKKGTILEKTEIFPKRQVISITTIIE